MSVQGWWYYRAAPPMLAVLREERRAQLPTSTVCRCTATTPRVTSCRQEEKGPRDQSVSPSHSSALKRFFQAPHFDKWLVKSILEFVKPKELLKHLLVPQSDGPE